MAAFMTELNALNSSASMPDCTPGARGALYARVSEIYTAELRGDSDTRACWFTTWYLCPTTPNTVMEAGHWTNCRDLISKGRDIYQALQRLVSAACCERSDSCSRPTDAATARRAVALFNGKAAQLVDAIRRRRQTGSVREFVAPLDLHEVRDILKHVPSVSRNGGRPRGISSRSWSARGHGGRRSHGGGAPSHLRQQRGPAEVSDRVHDSQRICRRVWWLGIRVSEVLRNNQYR